MLQFIPRQRAGVRVDFDVIEQALFGGFAFPTAVIGFETYRVITQRFDFRDCLILRYPVRARLVTCECRTACREREDGSCCDICLFQD